MRLVKQKTVHYMFKKKKNSKSLNNELKFTFCTGRYIFYNIFDTFFFSTELLRLNVLNNGGLQLYRLSCILCNRQHVFKWVSIFSEVLYADTHHRMTENKQ